MSEVEQFRSSLQIDIVAKILNYTEGLDEGIAGNTFWYAYNSKECIYKKASIMEVQQISTVENPKLDVNEENTVSASTQFFLNPNVRELKLNTWVPSTVKVGYVQNAGTWWGPNNYFLQVMANGITMLESNKPRDIDRTKSAWNQIFNKFCPGTRDYF